MTENPPSTTNSPLSRGTADARRVTSVRNWPRNVVFVLLLCLIASACSTQVPVDVTAAAVADERGADQSEATSTTIATVDQDAGSASTTTASPPRGNSLAAGDFPSVDLSEFDTGNDPEALPCVAPETGPLTAPPAEVVAALEAATNHPDFVGLDVGVSVWIDGWGEVATRTPNLPLVPASNEKILVAHAANELLNSETTIDTTVEQVGSDLVLRAAGDPTFSTYRANALVDQVVARGITSADRLVIDISEFPQPSAATGWESWQLRNFVGPLSGLMLDRNRWNTTAEFLETPALLNGQWMADVFRSSGIEIGTVEIGSPPTGRTVGSVESEPIGALVRQMMLASDNQIADMTVLQLGLLQGQGTLDDGFDQIDGVLAELCVPISGVMDDGSGLSRFNQRSAREFQEILRAIRETDSADTFVTQLPVGGVSGTLRNRFRGDAGRVQAKTGTIFGGRALSGYATTDSGRDAVFSIIINGERDRTSASLGALDALVRTILRS